MFMKDNNSGNLVEILDLAALANPGSATVQGRFHAGEEMQDPSSFDKSNLCFPSGESLPACWTQANYPH